MKGSSNCNGFSRPPDYLSNFISNGTSLSVVSITLCSTPFHGAFWEGYLTCCNCNLVNYFDPLFPHEFGDIFSKESWDG